MWTMNWLKNTKWLLLISILVLLSSLWGCAISNRAKTVFPTTTPTTQRLPEDFATQWLRGIPCQPPCWEGITPGQTTATEAEGILRNRSLVTDVKLVTSSGDKGYIYWNWTNGVLGGILAYYLDDAKATIRYIGPNFLGPNYMDGFALQEIIAAYGEPEYIVALTGAEEDGKTLEYTVDFVYLSKGFRIFALTKPMEKPVLGPELRVGGPAFFVPNKEGYGFYYSGKVDLLMPWQGYQDFDFYNQGPGK